jgi:hypothetical protein
MYKKLSTLYTLFAALFLSSCVVPGIQQTVNHIDNYHVYKKSSAATPHDLKVYCLDGRYYMEVELWYKPVETCMFYYEAIMSGTKGICVSGTKNNEVKKYLARLSDTDVFHILQRRVQQPGDEDSELIPEKDFDYARAERCAVNPVKFKFNTRERAEYAHSEYYYPHIEPFSGGTLHTLLRPVAWAAWGVEIPLFVASNAVFYGIYFPYRVVEVKVFGASRKD